jgi:hypothetical protein
VGDKQEEADEDLTGKVYIVGKGTSRPTHMSRSLTPTSLRSCQDGASTDARRAGVNRALDGALAWHNLAHSLGIPANTQESSGTSKTLMNLIHSESLNDVKAAKMASQALDEGSIPFTRSK